MIYWFFPVIVLVSAVSSVSKQESPEQSPLMVGLLDSAFLLPWVASLSSVPSPLSLLTLFMVSGLWLLLTKGVQGKIRAEAFTKLALSWCLGFVLLLVPFLKIGILLWPLNAQDLPHIAPWISVASVTTGLFLLMGLPPTQVGVIDAGDVWPRGAHIRSNLSFRLTLIFSVFVTIPAYLEKIPSHLLQVAVAFCFIGLALSRLVAGVQISVQRSLSYLSQGLVLPVLMLMGTASLPKSLSDFAAGILLLQAIIWASLYAGFQVNDAPKNTCWDDPEARMVPSLKRLPSRLRSVLHMESLLVLLYCGTLAYFGSYKLLLPGLFFILASQAVAMDEHAFAGRGQTSIN